MKYPDGTYQGTALEARVYESERTGALVCAIQFSLDNEGYEGKTITAYQTLVKGNGELSEMGITACKDVFGWDGQNPGWLMVKDNIMGRPAELVVVNELFANEKGRMINVSKVAFMNRPGGANRMLPDNIDSSQLAAKYGAKFRAMAGGTQVTLPKPATPATATPAAAEKPLARTEATPAKPKAPSKAKGMQSSMEECWAEFTRQHPVLPQDLLEEDWFRALRIAGYTETAKMTPADWAKFLALLKIEAAKTAAAGKVNPPSDDDVPF